MPYGTIKVDTITFTDAGVDKSVTISGLVQNPTFTGNVTATGTISGLIVQAPTVTGTTANFASGVYTTQISGAIVKVPAGTPGAPSIQVGVGASVAPGLYGAGTDLLGISTGGAGRIFIDSTGRLGVGTSSPRTTLDVAAASYTAAYLGGTGNYSLRLGHNNTDAQITSINAGTAYTDLTLNSLNTIFATGSGTLTERLRIDSSGRVGIGTTSPSNTAGFSQQLELAGSLPCISINQNNGSFTTRKYSLGVDSVGAFGIWDNTSNSYRFYTNTSGNVGIGTSSPGYSLHILGSTANLAIQDSGANGTRALIEATNSAVYYGSTYGASNIPTIFSQAGASGGIERARIDSSGNVGIGTSTVYNAKFHVNAAYTLATGAQIALIENSTIGEPACLGFLAVADNTSGGNLGAIYFDAGATGTTSDNKLQFTAAHQSTITPQVTLTGDGLVGIGTSSPGNALHVIGSIQVGSTSDTIYSSNFGNYSSSSDLSLISGSANLLFKTGAANTERARIDTSGNLGIGTSSPLTKLDVRSGVITAGTLESANGAEVLRGYYSGSGALTVLGTEYSSGGPLLGSCVKPSTSTQGAFLSSTGIAGATRGAYVVSGNEHKWYIGAAQTVAENSSVTMSEAMRIDGSGRLLVGRNATEVGLGGSDLLQVAGAINVVSSTNIYSRLLPTSNGLEIIANAYPANIGLPQSIILKSGTSGGGGPSEIARFTSDGKLLVGTSVARTNIDYALGTTGSQLQIEQANATTNFSIVQNFDSATIGAPATFTLARSGATSIGSTTVVANGNRLGEINFSGSDGTDFTVAACIRGEVDGTPGANDMPGRLVFSTTADGASSPTERMRIGNQGVHNIFSSTSSTLVSRSSAAANTSNQVIQGAHSATNTTNGTVSFIVYTNGNVENTNNSYGAISDIKLKENIVDANSQWDDLKALQVRNYNLKEGQTHTQIGLVAQEVELVSPGLVSESPDRDENGNDLGTVTKSINYSVLYMKAVKALQEAMERIEQLEASNADLLARVTALEAS
jgi:hypothetical protein